MIKAVTWTAQQLKNVPVAQRRGHLPVNLVFIVDLAVSCFSAQKIWLFGSRGRGDAQATSDFDLAFSFSNHREDWTRFHNQISENPPSLHKYDLIDFQTSNPKLQEIILREGVVLYEQ